MEINVKGSLNSNLGSKREAALGVMRVSDPPESIRTFKFVLGRKKYGNFVA